MKLQIKKYGDSKVIVLPPHYIKYMNLSIGDWIDIADANKCVPNLNKQEANNDKHKR